MDTPLGVAGVGAGPSQATTRISIPTAMQDGTLCDYQAPISPNSDIPALLGLKSMENTFVILDMRPHQRKLYLGGDVQILASDSTIIYDLAKAPSGHLILPTDHFDAVQQDQAQSREHFPIATSTQYQ